jgi:hypothetical protein
MTDPLKLRIKGIKYFAKVKNLTFAEAERYYDVDSLICACGAPKGRTHKACAPCAKVRCEESRAKYLQTHREQERRGDRIRHRIKQGMSRETAEAMEGVRGVCKCGKQARRANGRICEGCYREKDRASKRGKPLRKMAKVCATCGAEFDGAQNAKYCSLHKGGVKAKKVPARPVLPKTWERPMPAKPKNAVATVERIVNPGVQITRIPSVVYDWRVSNPDEFDPAKVRAVVKIMERMARR